MRPEFTIAELYAISLCVGWNVAMSEEDTPDAIHRRKYGNEALAAFRRALGEGFHATLYAALNDESATNTEPDK